MVEKKEEEKKRRSRSESSSSTSSSGSSSTSSSSGSSRSSSSSSSSRSPSPRSKRDSGKEHLAEIFGMYGPIKSCDLPPERFYTHLHRGYGYVEYENAEDAEKALKYFDGGQIDGQVVSVELTLNRAASRRSPVRKSPVRRSPARRRSPVRSGNANMVPLGSSRFNRSRSRSPRRRRSRS
ncbi:hypothetical protein OESDEN_14073 [Oesophagostomum dentatum]|uniref:RRM domain-containing protein n=1 Tax=Oesophagostomum dentatum TaxID=61180 RepID=A0A0B1SMP0_OESDE|nr:hypothetical protein OESDEN_14073 [Oesophagostomum dentatum]